MLLGVQILGMLFAIGLMYFSFLNYKRKELTKSELYFWTILWLLFIFVTIFPSSLDFILNNLSIARTMDLFTILGFLFLIALTFYNYISARKTKNKVETVIRKVAFANVKNDKK